MIRLIVIIGFLLSTISCSIEPVPIDYNHDECAYCKMKISDIRFGAELVTKKGKITKYDSVECLARTYIEQASPEYAFIIVTDYSRPHHLIDAESATFLISENQASPMGGNLSAYEKKNDVIDVQAEKGGQILNFTELISSYRSIYQ